ncbi:DUF732 domain-containing protein [Nocardia sp. NPDC058666]|uniref:DUF732 domain-containing protein n=1 Tax=Nocardia sp. NPDC058666 TaxID=3346587 RepID=UPI0036489781
MNRTPSVALAAFGASAALFLSACSSTESEPTPTAQQRVFPATAQEEATTTPEVDSVDQIYLAVLEAEGITELRNSNVDLVTFGKDVVCATFIEEGSPSLAFALGASLAAVDQFDSAEDAAYVVGAAVATYCPQFNYLFEQ